MGVFRFVKILFVDDDILTIMTVFEQLTRFVERKMETRRNQHGNWLKSDGS